ncbi:hypothetical protein lerEdw1_011395, partial [Lerista edwardsae]
FQTQFWCLNCVAICTPFLNVISFLQHPHTEADGEDSYLAAQHFVLAESIPSPPDVDLPSPEPRRRRDAWSRKETMAFIDIWKAEDVQIALGQQYRNMKLFAWIADRLRERGFERDAEQCRSRAKDLKRGYKEIKCGNLHSGRAPKTAPYFKLLEQFLCLRKGIVCGQVCGAGVVERLDKRRKRLPLNPMAATRIAREAANSAPDVPEAGAPEQQFVSPQVQAAPPKELRGLPSDPEPRAQKAAKDDDVQIVEKEDAPRRSEAKTPLPPKEIAAETQVADAGEEQRRLPGSNAERMRYRRERNWRQRLEMSRRLAESSPAAAAASSKAGLDLVDTLRQLHQQDLRAFEHTRQEERAEDKQERQQEKQERQQDRATTHRMIAAIERSHQTLADLMGRQTSAMEAIATAFSAPRYPSPGPFPGCFSPPWPAQQSVPHTQERQTDPSVRSTTPPHAPSQDEPHDAGPNQALPLPGPPTSLPSDPTPEAVPVSSPPALSTSPKRTAKRKNCD